MSRSVLALLVVPAAILAAVGAEAATAQTPAAHAPASTVPRAHKLAPGQPSVPVFYDTQYGPNWAGYVATSPRFRYIQATFRVPRANCHKTPGTRRNPAMLADWVGLDGYNQARFSVEQDGIDIQCVNGLASYGAWWETFPRPPVYPGVVISPGDQIFASVWYNPSLRKYRMILTDQTNGQGFAVWERCALSSCQNVSAEVITESPAKSASASAQYYPLADGGTSTFWGIKITDKSQQRGTFTSPSWNTIRLVMQDSAGRVKDSTSGLADGGRLFRTYWEHPS